MSHTFFPPQSAVEQIKRHPKYYLNGGDIHFLVRPSLHALSVLVRTVLSSV